MLTKLKNSLWQSSESHCLFKKQTLLEVKTTIILRVTKKNINLKLFRKPFGPINTEF